jgi:uncharacterized protein
MRLTIRGLTGVVPTVLSKIEEDVERAILNLKGFETNVTKLSESVERLTTELRQTPKVLSATVITPPVSMSNGTPPKPPKSSPKPKHQALGLSPEDRAAVVRPDEPLPGGHRRILLALARHGGCTKRKLGLLSGYAIKGGGFNNYLSAMRGTGYIIGDGNGPFQITPTGLKALGSYNELPDDSDELFKEWLGHKKVGKAHRLIMEALRAEESPMTKEALAMACEYEPTGGGFANALSTLRTLGIIEGKKEISLAENLRASDG